MINSILIPVADAASSRAVVEYITGLALSPDKTKITLLYVNRTPSGSEELMGYRFVASLPERGDKAIQWSRDTLVAGGMDPDNIYADIISGPFATVADGIMAYFKKAPHKMVVIGRKKMSKAEEFVLGDVSMKLVRALEETAVMVVKIN
ncbi:universal stress protein family protein [Desulfobotulus alkaliphilus]|uniref:Universal stress protein family protein n=1 Tax=Desulfobotulus alkaliphilus TaxID=622671 RepID=A0A562RNT9_9BACT|nr:universal stress protein [Desulfobotulus alkaliphilus]TWI70738.1 universal stress protein family protein [Desulfobotulus alkaliphilus]